MAVTSVTITSGPTVVGRSVTLSGTLDRDGGGTNNDVNFIASNAGFVTSPVLRISDNAIALDGSGSAGSGIAWNWTGTLPEDSYISVRAYQNSPPYNPLSSATSGFTVQLRKPLAGIWTPRRDARGMFVPISPSPNALPGGGRNFDMRRAFFYATPDGVYQNDQELLSTYGQYGGRAKGVPTQWGLGIDAPLNWQSVFSGFGYLDSWAPNAGVSVVQLAVFSLYNSGQYVDPSIYPAVFGTSLNSLPNDTGWYVHWRNGSGEQSLLISAGVLYGGASTSIDGVGNGLHCLVMSTTVGGGATGTRIFLDGKFITAIPATNYSGFMNIGPSFYWGSISQSHLNIGNVHFNGAISSVLLPDNTLAALSADPYRLFFRDAPSQTSRLTSRFISLPSSFQYSRPTTDILTGWARVPATGTHSSAINETTSNQTDYLSASSTGLIDSFTMGTLQQPSSGGLDINFDIDASARSMTIELLNGASVVKSASVGVQSGLGVFLPQQWRLQPQVPLQVDWGNSLSRGLCAAWHPAARQYIGPGVATFPTPGTFAYQSDHTGGFGVRFNAAANSRIALPAGSAGSTADYSGTRLVLFRPYGNGLGLVSGTVTSTLGMRLLNATQIGLVSASVVVVGSGNIPVLSGPTVALCTANGVSTETRMHCNGKLLVSATGTYASSSAGLYVGAITNQPSDANFFLALSWDRPLTLSESAAIQENPWRIFKPIKRQLFSLSSVVNTGTISVIASELSGVSWPWTPTVRITSQ